VKDSVAIGPVALERRLAGLGVAIDVAKATAVERTNHSPLFGAILMAMYPTAGAPAAALAGWDREVAGITHGLVSLRKPNLHLAEASLTNPPHLPAPLRPSDVAHVDFDRLLGSMAGAAPFVVRLVRIYLDPDGNLVVVGRMDGSEVLALREQWRAAGLWIKGHPAVPAAACTLHSTLTHVPVATWSALADAEIGRFRSWLEDHATLDPAVDLEVGRLSIVCMDRRTGISTLGAPIEFPLGSSPQVGGRRLAEEILSRFGALVEGRAVGGAQD
jgi:hypothetical protein